MREKAIGRRHTRHSERTVYIVWVLWVIGYSETGIAAAAGIRRKQVAGIVTRSDYSNRGAMSDEDRARALGQLLAARHDDDGRSLDGGLLDKVPMKVMPLRGRQKIRRRP